MAVKYDAALIPFFSERQSDGVNFELYFDKSIPHSDPKKMTQQLNDLLEKRVRKIWINGCGPTNGGKNHKACPSTNIFRHL